jgi:S-adenosylmethionine hydrolase
MTCRLITKPASRYDLLNGSLRNFPQGPVPVLSRFKDPSAPTLSYLLLVIGKDKVPLKLSLGPVMPISRLPSRLGYIVFLLVMTGLFPTSLKAAPAPVIALFTDYGWEDPYVGQIKGVILTVNPAARLLDLTHSVTPFNVTEGAYLLDRSAEEFPAGTIFVAVVDPQVGTDRNPILIQTAKGKFFIGPDNGLFSQVLLHEGFSKAWILNKPEFFRPGDISHTFHGRDIFAPIAAHLATGMDPERLGTPTKTLLLLQDKEPTFSAGLIAVQVLHIDHFGNVILNLPSSNDLAAKLKEGNLVKIGVGRESFSAPLVKTYSDVDKSRLLLLYGGTGLLEISMNQGSAAKELKVDPGTIIYLRP